MTLSQMALSQVTIYHRETKVFSSEGDSVVKFHDISETVDELPNLAAVHETFVLTN